MTSTSASTDRRRPEEIIQSLTTIISSAGGEIVFVTCVDADGFVGDSEAYASEDQPKSSLPLELLFSFPQEQGVDTVMVASRASESLEVISESDLQFTRELIAAGGSEGIEVLDHVLVMNGEYRRLRPMTDLWGRGL
ncbi:MAG: JAB domain-containing protein [Actinomycetota bacterium]